MSGLLLPFPAAAVATAERSPTAAPVGLTRRETEVLTLAAEGLTDAQIAHRLAISTRTVSTHMFNLRRHLDAANRTHAVVLAVQLGLISVHPPGRPTTESRR